MIITAITKSLPVHSKEEENAKISYSKSRSIEEIYEKYSNMIFQVSFSYLKSAADSEDIVADVFVKLINAEPKFQNEEHEKAWLLRTAINLCKNNLKHWRRKTVDIDDIDNIDEYGNLQSENQFNINININDTLKSVMELPERYKDVIYLYYYEGYSTAEIAKMLKKPHSSVRVHLHEARKILKGVLEEDEK